MVRLRPTFDDFASGTAGPVIRIPIRLGLLTFVLLLLAGVVWVVVIVAEVSAAVPLIVLAAILTADGLLLWFVPKQAMYTVRVVDGP